jgi:hypothetical protein
MLSISAQLLVGRNIFIIGDNMDKKKFVNQLKAALNNNELMTPKHDPNNLGKLTYSSYRSVLSYELADNLKKFIDSESFDVIEYENMNPRHKKEWFEIIPRDTFFSVPASGVGPDSMKPTEALDRLVAVWNSGGRPHLFGESSKEIEKPHSTLKCNK